MQQFVRFHHIGQSTTHGYTRLDGTWQPRSAAHSEAERRACMATAGVPGIMWAQQGDPLACPKPVVDRIARH